MTDETAQDHPEAEAQAAGEQKGAVGAGEKSKQADGKEKREAGFKDFVDGTTRIAVGVGTTLGEAFKGIAGCCSGRNNVVMVRVDDESLKRIDQLVDAGLFRSRSESAAWLIGRGIVAEEKVFSTLELKVEEINRLREELRSIFGLDDQEQEA
jgi:hypothetical protein